MSEEPITRIIKLSRGVDDAGAEAIWNEYFPKLKRVIENKLKGIPKRDFDGDDIAQNAMLSLFKGLNANKFDGLENRDELWRLLVTITARKITAEQRKAMAQKRGGGKTRGESVFEGPDGNDGFGINQLLDVNQMPETASKVLQVYESLLPEIKDAKTLQTVMLRMEGFSNPEIAEKMKCSVSRIEQRISSVKKMWQAKTD